MKRIVLVTVIVATGMLMPVATSAQDGCQTLDYQGAPLEVCPEPVPDPTNCYTGDYQGAPIEVCLPTGERLPEGSTMMDGSPVIYHESVHAVPSQAPAVPAVVAPVVAPQPPLAPATTVETAPFDGEPQWLLDLQRLLVANGGW